MQLDELECKNLLFEEIECAKKRVREELLEGWIDFDDETHQQILLEQPKHQLLFAYYMKWFKLVNKRHDDGENGQFSRLFFRILKLKNYFHMRSSKFPERKQLLLQLIESERSRSRRAKQIRAYQI